MDTITVCSVWKNKQYHEILIEKTNPVILHQIAKSQEQQMYKINLSFYSTWDIYTYNFVHLLDKWNIMPQGTQVFAHVFTLAC